MQRIIYLLMLALVCGLCACAANDAPKPMSTEEIAKARAVDEYMPPSIDAPKGADLKIVVNGSVSKVTKAIEAYARSAEAQPLVLTNNIYQSGNRNPASATLFLNLADPEKCLDCGINRFAYYAGNQLIKEWEYEVAVKEMVLAFDEHDSLSRFMSLVAQANLSITPRGNNRTEIAINIDYVLERRVTAYTARQLGNEKVIMPVTGISVLKFNSIEKGEMEDKVMCVSKGLVENQILDGIRANLK